jgi:hypothetical protein
MTFLEAISSGFRNYVGFSGRASRSEFWYWILFTVLVSIVTSITILKYCRAAVYRRSRRSGAWSRSYRRSRWGYAGCTTLTEAAGGGCSASFL